MLVRRADRSRQQRRGSYLVDESGELLNAITFIIFGAAILGPTLDGLDWHVIVYALLSLTAVRMLPVWLSLLGSGARGRTLAFVGWFGPRGSRRSSSP